VVAVKPLARVEGIVTEEVGPELVIYDQVRRVAHCLSPSAAAVFGAADGTSSPDELARDLRLEPAEITQALAELSACGLLEVPSSAGAGISRREVATRVAKVGAAAALIYSVDIAPAWASASVGCVSNAECVAKFPHVASATCINNTCTNFVCDMGYTDCNNNCTNLQTDVQNCGGCGDQCPTFAPNGMYLCIESECAIECNNGYTNCSGVCVNLQTDPSNCGTCGVPCGTGQTCTAGKCTSG
jgi:hypothetical protein